jgi:hypothetical protein
MLAPARGVLARRYDTPCENTAGGRPARQGRGGRWGPGLALYTPRAGRALRAGGRAGPPPPPQYYMPRRALEVGGVGVGEGRNYRAKRVGAGGGGRAQLPRGDKGVAGGRGPRSPGQSAGGRSGLGPA